MEDYDSLCLDTLLLPLVSLLFERLEKVMRRVFRYPEHNYLLYLPHRVAVIIADYYPVEIYTLNVECVIDFPYNNLCEHISTWVLMRVIIATICPKPLAHMPYARVILSSKLSLIIFIGVCGPVELLLV